jgi:hypothetical protein
METLERDRDGRPDRELYALLHLSPEASDDDVKRAYRQWAQVYHPDKHQTPQVTHSPLLESFVLGLRPRFGRPSALLRRHGQPAPGNAVSNFAELGHPGSSLATAESRGNSRAGGQSSQNRGDAIVPHVSPMYQQCVRRWHSRNRRGRWCGPGRCPREQ